jgi:hypothetical protein
MQRIDTGVWQERTVPAAGELKYRLLEPSWAAEATSDTRSFDGLHNSRSLRLRHPQLCLWPFGTDLDAAPHADAAQPGAVAAVSQHIIRFS